MRLKNMKALNVTVNTPANDNVIKSLSVISNELAAIGTDTTPVSVVSNDKSGDYAYASLGAPSHATSGIIIYSNPFSPTGEKVTIGFSAFAPDNATIDNTGSVWIECDPSGGTNYKPILGSTVLLNTIPNTGKNFVIISDVRGGNCRVAIKLGTISGSGIFGYNVGIIN